MNTNTESRTTKKSKPKNGVKKAKVKDSKAPNTQIKRSYPRRTLEDALNVPLKIKEYNNGKPWQSQEVGKAVKLTPSSVVWYYLSAASRDYGLTIGTRDTAEISITDFGEKIVYAASPTEEYKNKIQAFFNVGVFKAVYEHYNGSNLPELQYLSNTLKTKFDLDPQIHEEFINIYKSNCKYLGIENGLSNTNGSAHSPVIDREQMRVIAEPKNNKGETLKLFVALPFSERDENRALGYFNEVINNLIVPAAIEAGFQVETANKQGSDIIQSTIINELLNADLVLADLTDHNPNVLFELGFRIALNKPVIIMKAKGTKGIFDVDSVMRYYEYSPNLWRSTLEKDVPALKEHIEAAWRNRESGQTYFNLLTKR